VSDLLLPELDELTAPFWEGCRLGELRVQQCPQSGRLIHPPRYRSPFAPHVAPRWLALSGRGAIWSAAEPHPPLIPQFAALAPYNIVIVAADEDPAIRFVGNLVASEQAEIDSVAFENIVIGAPVRVVFQPVTDADGTVFAMPRWVLVDPG